MPLVVGNHFPLPLFVTGVTIMGKKKTRGGETNKTNEFRGLQDNGSFGGFHGGKS